MTNRLPTILPLLLLTACGGPDPTGSIPTDIRAADTRCKRFDPPSTAPVVTACVARWSRDIGCIWIAPLEADTSADLTCTEWAGQFADPPVAVEIQWHQRALYPSCSACYH